MECDSGQSTQSMVNISLIQGTRLAISLTPQPQGCWGKSPRLKNEASYSCRFEHGCEIELQGPMGLRYGRTHDCALPCGGLGKPLPPGNSLEKARKPVKPVKSVKPVTPVGKLVGAAVVLTYCYIGQSLHPRLAPTLPLSVSASLSFRRNKFSPCQ